MKLRRERRNEAKIEWRRKNKRNKKKISFTEFWRKNIRKF